MEKTVNDQHLIAISLIFLELLYISCGYRVKYARTNDSTTNECYNEEFLSIKSGCYNKRFCMLLLWKVRL
jgi:hypothetical protein